VDQTECRSHYAGGVQKASGCEGRRQLVPLVDQSCAFRKLEDPQEVEMEIVRVWVLHSVVGMESWREMVRVVAFQLEEKELLQNAGQGH
jgi:hypothetical protein